MNRKNATKIKKRSKEGGFTLLEIIVAISILTVGILAVASMQIASIRGNAFARGTSEGTSWAVDKIEKLVVLPYDNADLDAGSHGPVNQGRYRIEWSVTEDTIIANTKTITVTVEWEDHGVTKSVSMQRVIPEIT